MTPVQLTTIAGIVLSLFFSYVPGVNARFAALLPEYKRLIMLGLLLVTSLVIFGLSCWTATAPDLPGVTCDLPGAVDLFWTFLAAVIANQATFAISPQPKAVRESKR
jgi:hypothetical protein